MDYRTILNLLPRKIANSFFARVLNKVNFPSHSKYFINAPLKYAKGFKMNLFPSDIGHRYIAFTGIYELELTKLIVNIAINEGGLLLDVGANYGYFSLLWSQFKDNNVIAFEASPKNFPYLLDNVSLNNLNTRIEAYELALSDRKGILTFDMGPEDQTGWGGLNHLSSETQNNSTIDVSSITLDDFAIENNILQISVLKIDTEGADTLVLSGAKNLIKNKKIKHIFWEHNLHRMQQLGLTENTMINFLTDCGYKINMFNDNEYYASL